MLNKSPESKFTPRAKEEAKKLLAEMNITELNDDNLYEVEVELDTRVSGLVTMDESEHRPIDHELLEIYDTLTDIILEHEEEIDFLNKLFLE